MALKRTTVYVGSEDLAVINDAAERDGVSRKSPARRFIAPPWPNGRGISPSPGPFTMATGRLLENRPSGDTSVLLAAIDDSHPDHSEGLSGHAYFRLLPYDL